MKKLLFKLILLLSIVLLQTETCYGQTAEAWFQSPLNEEQGVPLAPTLIIKTQLKIATNCITFEYPDVAESVHDNPHDPSVVIIPKMLADSLADSLWRFFAEPGTFSVTDDNTLEFTPLSPLAPNTAYLACIKNLCVIDTTTPGDHDTLMVGDTCICFNTVEPLHELMATNIDAHVGCDGKVFAAFNRDLAAPTTGLGDIISIEKVDDIQMLNNEITYVTSPVATNTWLDPANASIVYAEAVAPLDPNKQYFAQINVSHLTGESNQDYRAPLKVKDGYAITIKTANVDPLVTLPPAILAQEATYYAQSGQTTSIGVFEDIGGYVFQGWTIVDGLTISSSATSVLDFNKACDDPGDIVLTAQYALKRTIVLTVEEPVGSGGVQVVSSSGLNLGGVGSFQIAPNDYVFVFPLADPGMSFVQWESDDPRYDGAGDMPLRVQNNGSDIKAKTLFELDPNPDNTLCTAVRLYGEGGCLNPANIVTISPAPGEVVNSGSMPQDVAVSATVIDPCFKIFEVWNNGSVEVLTTPADSYGGTFQTSWQKTVVTFVVGSVDDYDLTVETELQDIAEGEIGPDKDVSIFLYKRVYDCSNNSESYERRLVWQTASPSETRQFPCRTEFDVVAMYNLREEGFDFIEWHHPTSNPENYIWPTPVTDEEFTFTLEEDSKIKGFFREHFRLRQIGFYRDNNRQTPEWFSTLDLKNSTTDDVEVFDDPTDGYGSKIHFRFNKPVDETSLWVSPSSFAEVFNNMFCYDQSERVDLAEAVGYPADNPHVTLINGDREVILELTGNGSATAIPRGEEFAVYAGGGIRSSTSEPLINPGGYSAETELPGVHVIVKSIKVLEGSGDGAVELYVPWVAQVRRVSEDLSEEDIENADTEEELNELAELIIEEKGQIPHYQCFQVQDVDQTINYNQVLLNTAELKTNDFVTGVMEGYDIDDDNDCEDGDPINLNKKRYEDWELTAGILGATAGAIAGGLILSNVNLGGVFGPSSFLATIISAGFMVGIVVLGAYIFYKIFEFFALDERDLLAGPLVWNYPWRTKWFGAHPGAKSGEPHNFRKLRYWMEFRLKKTDSPTSEFYN